MQNEAEKEVTDLVSVPDKDTALDVFKAEQGLDPYLETIRAEVDRFIEAQPPLDTAKGRKAYASMAYKITRSRTAIDGLGKELVADLKQLPKTIDAERKRWRDTLDAWRDEVRGPLNEWEAVEEQRRREHEDGIARLREMAEGLEEADSQRLKVILEDADGTRVDESWEEYEAEAHRVKETSVKSLRAALLRLEKYEAEQAELARLRAEKEEQERKDREEKIAKEAEERAKRQADEAARAEREAGARREQAAKDEAAHKEREAKESAERREREHHEAIEKTKREAEQERQRIKDDHRRREEERLTEERREKEEAAKRQADKQHKGRVNREAMQAMIDGGMTEDCAKQAITMIAKGQVPNITVNY